MIFDYKSVQNWHRNHSRHHSVKAKTHSDFVQMVVDWECARSVSYTHLIQKRDHCLTQTRKHLCSKVNPEANDFEEEVKVEEEFFANDDVIKAMLFMTGEKEKLTIACLLYTSRCV